MMRRAMLIAAAILTTAAFAQDDNLLTVRGRGTAGGPGYGEGGVVEFQSVSLGANVLHYERGEEFSLPIAIAYEVQETAPITLNSRFGTEYWLLYHFEDGTLSRIHTHEDINLSEAGAHTAVPADLRAWVDSNTPPPDRGLVGIRGHHYFLIDPLEGDQWLDTVNPPAFFNSDEVARTLTFTLADLSSYEIAVDEVQSTWEAGGPIRVRVTVTDAQGDTYPVVNAPLIARAGGVECPLQTQFTGLEEPNGWMTGVLPAEVPEQVRISGRVTLLTPRGPEFVEVDEQVERGEGQVTAEAMQAAELGYELPRNDEGTIRETRGLWVSTGEVMDRAGIDNMVERADLARLNILIPDIFYRNTFLAESEIMPISDGVEEGLDPLAYMVEQSHAAGMEMHPWFAVNYRNPDFTAWFEETYGEDVRFYDEAGEVQPLAADLHREAYRDFLVNLMVDVAANYDVDGIHLDYIRTRGRCYCEDCRAEFEEQFGVPLTEATDEQWVEWNRQAISDIVQRTAEGVEEVNPDAIISAAVFASVEGGAAQGQDPARWANEGWVDVIMPMDYSLRSLEIRSNERQFLAAIEDDSKLATGLSVYQRSGEEVSSRDPELVQEQINMVRSMGIHGYVLFSLRQLSDEQIEMLRESVNDEEAVPYYR